MRPDQEDADYDDAETEAYYRQTASPEILRLERETRECIEMGILLEKMERQKPPQQPQQRELQRQWQQRRKQYRKSQRQLR